MKRNLLIGILVILVLVFAYLAFLPNSPQEKSAKQSHFASALSASGNITCTYPQVLHASYQSGEITHDLPRPETNPIIVTFSNIKSEAPKIQFIDATQNLGEAVRKRDMALRQAEANKAFGHFRW